MLPAGLRLCFQRSQSISAVAPAVASSAPIFAATAGSGIPLLDSGEQPPCWRHVLGDSRDHQKIAQKSALMARYDRHGRTHQTLKIYLCWGCERLPIGV